MREIWRPISKESDLILLTSIHRDSVYQLMVEVSQRLEKMNCRIIAQNTIETESKIRFQRQFLLGRLPISQEYLTPLADALFSMNSSSDIELVIDHKKREITSHYPYWTLNHKLIHFGIICIFLLLFNQNKIEWLLAFSISNLIPWILFLFERESMNELFYALGIEKIE